MFQKIKDIELLYFLYNLCFVFVYFFEGTPIFVLYRVGHKFLHFWNINKNKTADIILLMIYLI